MRATRAAEGVTLPAMYVDSRAAEVPARAASRHVPQGGVLCPGLASFAPAGLASFALAWRPLPYFVLL